MEQVTYFVAPSHEDYDNVRALNTAFIAATSTLHGVQRDRLASTPFLLFSLRETDEHWWHDALKASRQHDLIADGVVGNSDLYRVQTAALGFLWQLARRNAYAVRVVSGANHAWCEKITALPLLSLLDRVADRGDLIESRIHGLGHVGERLSGSGASANRRLRTATHLSALHTVLAHAGIEEARPQAAAACRLSAPLRRRSKKV